MEGTITIRRLERGDVDMLLAVQSSCPELAQWSKRDYEEMLESGVCGWVAWRTADTVSSAGLSSVPIAGFLTAQAAADEIEILNLGVMPEERRRGIGKGLLEAAFAWGAENRARRVFLEVRASNRAAIQFYEAFGFRVAGRRAKYYSAPAEDALQLVAAIA